MPQTMKAGEAVIEMLRREGVTHIFGIVGSSFLDILDPLYDRDDIEFVGVRHEQGAALMADGFSRISGAPSVCLVTNGPGVLNLTYGIAAAYVAHSPVVVLAPSASRDHQYRDSTQEFDQVSLFRPITKASFTINKVERLPDALRQAFRVATSGQKGPVLLDIPRDLMPGSDLELDLLPPEAYRTGQTRSRGDRNLVDKAARVLLAAQRPVIIAGGGIQFSMASEEVTQLAETLGAAIVTTYGRADAVPSEHPKFLGHLGRLGSVEAIEAIQRADVILAAGTGLGQSTTFFDHRFIPSDASIVQIDIDPRGEATRTRILDSAEHLFSEHGVNGASLRTIVAHADVNTAAVHYHFGSKKGLLEAVFARRTVPIAEERLQLLADCRDGEGRLPLLHQIIAAFLEPGMRGDHGGATFARLRARMAADASDETRDLMARYFDYSSGQFLKALADALPGLPPRDLHWRFHCLLGTMVYSMANPRRIQALTDNACDPSDMDATLAYLVPFLAQGFLADPIPEVPIGIEPVHKIKNPSQSKRVNEWPIQKAICG